jgi:hypothetical protein
MQAFNSIELDHVTGGADAPAAPPAAPDPIEQARQAAREEFRMLEKERETDQFRAWEKRHPFSAFACQGDRSCMR